MNLAWAKPIACVENEAIKKPQKGLISPRMGAFAWQLCCRAHARAYYDHAVFKHHALIGTALGTVRQLDAYPAKSDYRRHKPANYP